MIYCSNIKKSYQSIHVLRGVNLHIEKGALVSIMGSSGAGKSTLLHILGTLDEADEGQIILDNSDIAKLNRNELAQFRNKQIGFIFQFHHLLPEFTALENTCLPGWISKKNENDVIKEAKTLLDYLGLNERFDHKPGQLSGGEQQRIALARALINKPKIIFADEPTGNLDQKNAQEVLHLLLSIRKEMNITMLLVTHDPMIAAQTDHTYMMKDGIILP
ncbi:MAG: ABC transporter ATP-binding protein [Bacteroidota bacterium]|nr:ABC transporter ATP-binding protein [Bacteroidota bacterium]